MEKNQYNLVVSVLKKLNDVKVLPDLVLIGSWATLFYKDYYFSDNFFPVIFTRDIDFLFPSPLNSRVKVDLVNLFKDLGFVIDFKGPEGHIKLQHPELIIEFLVPEKGRGSSGKPFKIPKLGINATALRFLGLLTDDTIKIVFEDIPVTLPHPINFAYQKLIIASRRSQKEKTEKDIASAVELIKSIVKMNQTQKLQIKFKSLPPKWQAKVLDSLKKANEFDIISILNERKEI